MKEPDTERAGKRIGALFTDYDGTIAPADVPRAESKVPEPILSKLVALSSKIPIAIITAKDYHFIKPRTIAFAKAWACVSGLDIRMAGDGDGWSGSGVVSGELEPMGGPDIETSLKRLQAKLPPEIVVERKHASNRGKRLLGFSVDWTTGPRLTNSKVDSITRLLEKDGLYVSRSPSQTYIDAFAMKPSKGAALSFLAKKLGVGGETGVVYMGDSGTDNDAFDIADVSIGIDNGEPIEELRCSYLLAAKDVGAFLGSLLENDLHFSPSLSPLILEAKATRIASASP